MTIDLIKKSFKIINIYFRHTEINLWGPTLAEDDLNPDLSEASKTTFLFSANLQSLFLVTVFLPF